MATYDCCIFYEEVDVLLLRLVELAPVVDCFVVVEGSRTFQGAERELVFPRIRDQLEDFLERIEYVPVTDHPGYPNAWINEFMYRNAILRGLRDAGPTDTVLIADVDEVPARAAVQELGPLADGEIVELTLSTRLYGFSWEDRRPWGPVRAVPRRLLDFATPQELRNHLYPTRRVADAGWHLTSFYRHDEAIPSIKRKIRAVAHTELASNGYDEERYLSLCLRGGAMWTAQPKFSRVLRYCEPDDRMPMVVRESRHRDRFADYLIADGQRDRAAEHVVRRRHLQLKARRASMAMTARARRATDLVLGR